MLLIFTVSMLGLFLWKTRKIIKLLGFFNKSRKMNQSMNQAANQIK